MFLFKLAFLFLYDEIYMTCFVLLSWLLFDVVQSFEHAEDTAKEFFVKHHVKLFNICQQKGYGKPFLYK